MRLTITILLTLALLQPPTAVLPAAVLDVYTTWYTPGRARRPIRSVRESRSSIE